MAGMDSPIHFLLALLLLIPASAQTSPPRPSAASGTSSSPKRIPKPPLAADSGPDQGSVTAGLYRNRGFAFSCKIPAGWVLRTDELSAPPEESAPTRTVGATTERVLLAAFARPPQARGEDINSSILIAAESAAAYPGLTEAAQYFGPVGEVAKAQGLEMIEEPYEFELGGKTLVRGDFQKDVGSRVLRQSTLVMLARGYAVSFTFIGGTEDEVEELVGSLSFSAAAKAPSH
jgi:hypothetical protein